MHHINRVRRLELALALLLGLSLVNIDPIIDPNTSQPDPLPMCVADSGTVPTGDGGGGHIGG